MCNLPLSLSRPSTCRPRGVCVCVYRHCSPRPRRTCREKLVRNSFVLAFGVLGDEIRAQPRGHHRTRPALSVKQTRFMCIYIYMRGTIRYLIEKLWISFEFKDSRGIQLEISTIRISLLRILLYYFLSNLNSIKKARKNIENLECSTINYLSRD